MLFQVNANVATTAKDSIHSQNFYYLMVNMGKNVIIFGFDINSSVHIDNQKKDFLIFGKGSTKVLVILR